MSKEIWFAYFEECLADGLNEDEACDKATDMMNDHIADMTDYMVDRAKDFHMTCDKEKGRGVC